MISTPHEKNVVKIWEQVSHGRIIWMLQIDVLLILFDPYLSAGACLPDVDLTAFVGRAVYGWSLYSQVVIHSISETGIFLGVRSTDFMLCLDNNLL